MSKKRKLIMIAGIFLVSVFLIYSGVCLFIANSVISSMADVRVEKNAATLADYGLTGEQISVTSADGIEINAYIVPNPQARGNVLILHGMHGMDATSLFDYASFIYQAGFSPVVVDMRAHGKSGGESLSFGYLEPLDVRAVVEYLDQDHRFAHRPVILYGLSMGGSTALNTAAAYQGIDGVVAISPFYSIQNQVQDYMARDGAPGFFIKSFMPYVNLVLRFKFGISPGKESPGQLVRALRDIPVLIAHGEEDSQTAFYQGEKLYQATASANKQFWPVPGAEHLIVEDVLGQESQWYRQQILDFLNSYFPN